METVNVNIETPEIRVDVVQNEPPVVVVNVERQVIETVDAAISRPVTVEARAGKNGERGEKGERGDAGEPGKDGANGKDGQRGERGEKGERGDDGADGERGAQGIKGDKGDRGERGDKGEQGKDGKDGQRGRDGKDGAKGEKGERGEPGERGDKGRDGKDGIGFPGPPGKQGPPGNSAPHTHPLSEIEQSGAAVGQVPIWDEGAGEWIPGNAPGGGASIIEKTYAEMAAHIAADELTPGQWYNITDAAGTDLGFICLALTENEISVGGSGGYLNADFQAVGDYSGVAVETGTAAGTQLGIWRTGFEALTIPYTNLQFPPDYVSYSSSSGLLDAAETFTTDLGTTGEVITDDGAGTVTVQNLSQPLVPGEIITGDNSGETVTVDAYTVTQKTFLPGETITGSVTGATAVIVTDDGASSMTAYMTSAGVGFDGSEVLDNGAGVTADMDGAAGTPTIVEGDLVIWNLIHWQLTDATVLDGTNPATNTAAYTELARTVADVGYVEVWDVTEYYFNIDEIKFRSDNKSNRVFSSGSSISIFPWGNEKWGTNSLFADAEINAPNFLGTVTDNTLNNGSSITNIFGTETSGIQSNILTSGTEIDNINLGADASLFSNTLSAATVSNIIIGANGEIGNNILENGGQLTGITAGAGCSISRNKIGQGATMGGSTTMGDGARINDCNLGASAEIGSNTLGANVPMESLLLESSAAASGNTFADDASGMFNCAIGIDASVSNNQLSESARISGLTLGLESSYSNNTMGVNSRADNIIMAGNASISQTFLGENAQFANLQLGLDTEISNKTLDDNVTFSDKVVRLVIDANESISTTVEGTTAQPGFSDIPKTFDVTGLTTLDWLAANNYVGIGNIESTSPTTDTVTYSVSSGVLNDGETYTTDLGGSGTIIHDDGAGTVTLTATAPLTAGEVITGDGSGNTVTVDTYTVGGNAENINQIDNPPTAFPFTLRPASGLALTVTGTAISGIGAGQIALTTADVVLSGDNGEWLELEADPSGGGFLREKNRSGTLI